MNLKNLTDTALLNNTKSLTQNERELLTQILHHLREVDRRRLYSALKYKSLFEYAIHELNYSEDQAYRRINAMKLLKELPQIEEKLNTGALTLSNISVATQVFRKEAKVRGESRSTSQKLEMLQALENKSKREAEQIIQGLTSLPKEALKPEFIKPQGEEHIEVRFTAKKSLESKIHQLKGLLAHSHPNLSTAELFEKLCDEFIAQRETMPQQLGGTKNWGKLKNHPRHQEGARQTCTEVTTPTSQRPHRQEDLSHRQPLYSHLDAKSKNNMAIRRFIPTLIKRHVWQRDQGKCRNCGSQFALEIDHIKPFALNGPRTTQNLRLLCKSCNQRAAIEVFGRAKMEKYLNV